MNEVEVAHLEGASFAAVGADDVAGASLHDERHGSKSSTVNRVVLVRTDLETVFKLGNVSEDGSGLTFDSEEL